MKRKILIILSLCLSIVLPNVVHSADGILNIASAANLTYVMPELITEFESDHKNVNVRLSLASTGALYSQIRNGAPYDIFLAADEKRPTLLYKQGHTDGKAFVYAKGSIVLISDKNLAVTDGLESLLSSGFKKIVIANPMHAPYGMAAKEALEGAGLWEMLRPKLIYAENIGQAAHFVLSGSVQAGFLAESLLKTFKLQNLNFYPVSKESFSPILQRGVVLKRRGRASGAARMFKKFLFSEKAKTILKKYGYGEM